LQKCKHCYLTVKYLSIQEKFPIHSIIEGLEILRKRGTYQAYNIKIKYET